MSGKHSDARMVTGFVRRGDQVTLFAGGDGQPVDTVARSWRPPVPEPRPPTSS